MDFARAAFAAAHKADDIVVIGESDIGADRAWQVRPAGRLGQDPGDARLRRDGRAARRRRQPRAQPRQRRRHRRPGPRRRARLRGQPGRQPLLRLAPLVGGHARQGRSRSAGPGGRHLGGVRLHRRQLRHRLQGAGRWASPRRSRRGLNSARRFSDNRMLVRAGDSNAHDQAPRRPSRRRAAGRALARARGQPGLRREPAPTRWSGWAPRSPASTPAATWPRC